MLDRAVGKLRAEDRDSTVLVYRRRRRCPCGAYRDTGVAAYLTSWHADLSVAS